MVMICVHTRFHLPCSNGSLVIAIKPKTKYKTSCSYHVIVLHSAPNQTNPVLNGSCIFFENHFNTLD